MIVELRNSKLRGFTIYGVSKIPYCDFNSYTFDLYFDLFQMMLDIEA